MAGNLYESVMTQNKQLAEFFDANHNAASMVKKVISMVVRINDEQIRKPCDKLGFEVYSPRGSDVIVIRIKKPE